MIGLLDISDGERKVIGDGVMIGLLDISDGERKVIVDDRHDLGNIIINLLSSSLMTV